MLNCLLPCFENTFFERAVINYILSLYSPKKSKIYFIPIFQLLGSHREASRKICTSHGKTKYATFKLNCLLANCLSSWYISFWKSGHLFLVFTLHLAASLHMHIVGFPETTDGEKNLSVALGNTGTLCTVSTINQKHSWHQKLRALAKQESLFL